MPRLLLLTCLALTSFHSHAEDSWFDSALNFFGLGDETKEVPVEPASKAASGGLSEMATQVATSSLTSMVTSQLGVSNAQAQGGLGTLFGLAKSSLGDQEFSQLKANVPEMDSLLAAAPAISEQAQGLTSLMGSAGQYGKALQGATQAYSQFKELGIGIDKVPAYINVTNSFLKSQGSDDAATLFQKGVSALLSGDN